MKLIPYVIIFLFLVASCDSNSPTQPITGATTIEPAADISEEEFLTSDCRVAISALEAELEALKAEKETKEEELGKKLREARVTQDELKLQALNEEIDELSQRIKELRKGLIPTLESQIAAKRRFCP